MLPSIHSDEEYGFISIALGINTMLDGSNTTLDWQNHPTEIIILPVGAFEQHDAHLPLDTDSIQCDAMARIIADALDCALLPTLRIASSYEHTGFRGTFSLKPETLMGIVRDIAADAARQNFKILILANGHGGNHFLVPVCRDINRLDGPIKILLVDLWSFYDKSICDGSNHRKGLNIHANEEETSVMLALRPDLVRPERPDAQYRDEPYPLAQTDLTMFGIGCVNPNGAVGWPSDATSEKGAALIESFRARIIPFLKNRIERLRDTKRYSGAGGVSVRAMIASDIPACMRLKEIAGWHQRESDLNLVLESNPGGCFVAVHNGTVCGTAMSVNFQNSVAWIGMVLVDPDYRRMGIATRLMNAAVESLSGCETVKLDATPDGCKVYEKIGFVEEYRIARMTADRPQKIPRNDASRRVRSEERRVGKECRCRGQAHNSKKKEH